jgi:hypothetical protein
MRAKHVLPLCLFAVLISCLRHEQPAREPSGDSGGTGGGVSPLLCTVSGRPAVGRPFEVLIQRLRVVGPLPKPTGAQPSPSDRTPALQALTGQETVTLSSQDDMTFSPSYFTLSSGGRKRVIATINSTQSGLASFSALGTAGGACLNYIVAGFLGHLKIDPVRLTYNMPQILTVDLQDSNGNPLLTNIPIYLYIQTSDALLTQVTVANGRDRRGIVGAGEVFSMIGPGAFSTSQLSLISPSLWGGPVHLTVIARTSNYQTVAQGNFTFESDPVTWLPISLAIGGGLLYGIYS